MRRGEQAGPDVGKESLKMEVGQSWQERPSVSAFLLLLREGPGQSCPQSPATPFMAAAARLLLRAHMWAKEAVEHSCFGVSLLSSAT